MKRISALICFLISVILYATDQINLHLSQVSISNMGMSVELGYIDNIFTIILSVIFAGVGIYLLIKSKNES